MHIIIYKFKCKTKDQKLKKILYINLIDLYNYDLWKINLIAKWFFHTAIKINHENIFKIHKVPFLILPLTKSAITFEFMAYLLFI